MPWLRPELNLTINYFRQKDHIKLAQGLSFGTYVFVFVHCVIMIGLWALIYQIRDSVFIQDLGEDFINAIKTVIVS